MCSVPLQLGQAIAAIYAYARRVDDVADDPDLPLTEKRARLEQLRASLDQAPGSDLMLVALADARERYPYRFAGRRGRPPRGRHCQQVITGCQSGEPATKKKLSPWSSSWPRCPFQGKRRTASRPPARNSLR